VSAQWDLGFERIDQGEHLWVPVRAATDEEVDQLSAAHADIRAWMMESPYSRLNADYLAFMGAMTSTARNVAATGRLDGRELKSALDTWLSDLRAFDDRTSHLVSSTYGKDSAEYAAWKAALRIEFDTNFAYRFSYKLRNFSQHVREVVQHMSFTSQAGPHGDTEVALRVEFDPAALLDQYREWGPVRKDLEAFQGRRFDVLSTVIGAMESCNRAMQQLVLAESERIERACSTIETVSREVSVPDSIPIYMKIEPHPDGTMTNRLMLVRPDMAERAREMLARCRTELAGRDAPGEGAPEARS
jgi:hypothetical protein